MFVSQINVQNFKGIKKCEKPLELADFTVLIGRNNSGKSSILEALSLLPLPLHSLPYYDGNSVDLLERLHGGKSSVLYAYSGSALIEYLVQGRTWKIDLREQGETYLFIKGYKGITVREQPVRCAAVALGMKPRPKQGLWRRINSKVFFIPNDTTFLDVLANNLIQERNQNLVVKMGVHVRITRELINKCVDDKYTEILFTPRLSARKELMDGNVIYVKIKDLGDGIEKAALIGLWLETLNPSLVLWDDFEGSAHPSLIKVLLTWLSKKKWQVILSSHSIDVLNALLDVRPRNTKVIQLKKTGKDLLLHEDVDLEELETLIEANQDPRKLVDLLKL